MATCPNKNLPEWRQLVENFGDDIAHYLWDRYDGYVPDGFMGQTPVFYDKDNLGKVLKERVIEEFSQIPDWETIENRARVASDHALSNSISYKTLLSDRDGILYIAKKESANNLRGEDLLRYVEDGLSPSGFTVLTLTPVVIEKDINGIDIIRFDIDYMDSIGGPVFDVPVDLLFQQGYTVVGEFDNFKQQGQSQEKLLFQTEEQPMSAATESTLNKVREAAKKMGISIEDLTEYAKKAGLNTKSLNGVADLVKGVIAIAQGKENVSLTEEFVHIATAMLEQTNPQLITSLISKIDRFKIYKATLDAYKGNKNYQLSNGKPDIRKIKKEAVDKLIAEVIINQSEGSTEFPELMKEEERSFVRRMWEAILDAIRGMYSKTNIDLFEEVAKKVISGEIQNIPLTEENIYYQLKNDAVDSFYDHVIDIDSRMELIPETEDQKRHYLFDGKPVAKSVTERIKEKNKMPDRTVAQKEFDEQKREWGNRGHRLLEQYITTNLIDKDGYKRDVFLNEKIETDLPDEVAARVISLAKELIGSYKEGTRFIVEKKVINEKVKGGLASTIDFMAIEPNEKTGIKVDVLDWKFLSINKGIEEDVPWYKRDEWKEQMGEYTKIMTNYGLKNDQLRKRRMLPFIINYDYSLSGDRKTKLVPKSIEIGALDSLKETTLYLLPVALPTESTGNTRVDSLLDSLRKYYQKIYQNPVSPENKLAKNIQLNQISAAIRHLHLALNFEPLVNVGVTFLQNAKKTIEDFKNIDYDQMSEEELKKKLEDLRSYKQSAEKFRDLHTVYTSHIPVKDMTEDDKKTLSSLNNISSSTERMLDEIDTIQTDYVINLATRRGFKLETWESEQGERLKEEVPVSGFAKTFEEASKLPAKLINLASNLMMRANSAVAREYNKRMNDFQALILPLEQEARNKGKKAFDLIGTITPKGLFLVKELDSTYWNALQDARTKKDKSFLKANMNMEEFNRLSKEFINKGIEEFNKTQFSSDERVDTEKREAAIKRLKDSVDINRNTFDGYETWQFGQIFNQVINKEGHYSKEYTEMSKEARAVWQFFTELNRKAKKLGYIDRQGSSFFPLIEASMIEKLYQNGETIGQLKEFFTDLYTVRVDEEQGYSKRDPETHELKKTLHKPFTRTDKKAEQLSRDVSKVGSLWLWSLLNFEAKANLETALQTIVDVEKSRGTLIVDNGKIVFEGGIPAVNDRENRNAEIIKVIVDDFLYGLKEDLSSLGNIGVANIAEKLKKDEESRERSAVDIRKGLRTLDTWVRILGVGLKPLIGFANWAGFQIQSYITSGNMYKFSEFEKNNIRVTVGNSLSTIERGLIDLIVPLNEDMTMQKRRQLARKNGLIDYLSTWSFVDVMMVTNSFPERRLQFANALSMIENSMVKDGKIVNIRQYIKAQDRANKYSISQEERRQLEKTYEERVKKLKDENSLIKTAKIENNQVVIEGVTDEALADFRTSIIEYARTLNGQMNDANKAGYRRDTIFTSFMMFKTWIPKLVSTRTEGLKENIELNEWSYGRTRAFAKTIVHLGFRNITKMRDIILGTEEGLKILNEMLEQKKLDYYRKTGQTLTITQEEFYDVMRRELSREMKELGVLFSTVGMVIAARAAEPPEDATDLEKNRYKFWARAINKMSDEIQFYYNPMSMESITRGSFLPSLGLLSKAWNLLRNIEKETRGYIINDQELIDDAHPLKYFLNLVPVGYQFQNEVLPYIDPELAKEMGIRVSVQSRRQ